MENNNDVTTLKDKNENIQNDSTTIVQNDKKNGQNKCPKCGSTDISLNINTGCLRCNFCRCEFEAEKVEDSEIDADKLQGKIIGAGAQNIVADANEVLTFKCSSCGAEVVIDTASATQARCHWCRNTLSINQQIPNGGVPDIVLPFKIRKEDAKTVIENFVKKRQFFAHPKFKEEFTTNNIMGVYFPYMVIDINGHSNLVGQGEKTVRRYTVKNEDHYDTYYDADLYYIEREFDIIIENLTVESSSDKLNKDSSNKTTNIINAIMPFDMENSVKWDPNYLKGFSSEKRDTNIEQLKPLVEAQAKDIARFAANETLNTYDRGVAWSKEELSVKGQQWKAAYLPVWLYSYQQVKGNKKMLHYVAVNARTKEVMGSVPIHIPKLIGASCIVELFALIAMLFVDFDYNWIFLIAGFVYYFVIYSRYRNSSARHRHELETKRKTENMRKVDRFIRQKKGLSNSIMDGANNKHVNGDKINIKKINNSKENNSTSDN